MQLCACYCFFTPPFSTPNLDAIALKVKPIRSPTSGLRFAPSIGCTSAPRWTTPALCGSGTPQRGPPLRSDPDPHAGWVFSLHQLNTPQSEGLGRLVAQWCSLGIELREKGKSGIGDWGQQANSG